MSELELELDCLKNVVCIELKSGEGLLRRIEREKSERRYRKEYTRLGNSGLKISKVILGAMSYGSPKWAEWVLDEEAPLPLLEHAYKKGINTWDTALTKYSIPRDRVVILTKCYFRVTPLDHWDANAPVALTGQNEDEYVNRAGLSRKHIFDSVDDSVRRLGTYIDVLQIHRLDRDVPREEIMKALNDVVESGKVRYIGASSMAAWEFQNLQNIAEKHGWHKFVSMQNYYNLIYREEEREMIPYCRDTGVGLIPWSPIARGILARPWGAQSHRSDRDGIQKMILNDQKEMEVDAAIVGRVEEIAKKHGVSMATVATAWCLGKDKVNPIIGLNSKERIDQTVESLKFKLSEEDEKYLEELYRPKNVFGF
ncbi:MAG: hypothetical protein M1837_004226 [Sclerophora amabilis]|nr:MAG: hypothetical protein M1837_004226 [Sclerophora amabilis]